MADQPHITLEDAERLRESIHRDAELTKMQIESISESAPFTKAGTIISLFVSFLSALCTYRLLENLPPYWVMANFTLIFVWSAICLLNISKNNILTTTIAEKSFDSIKNLDLNVIHYLAEILVKDVAPVIYALSTLFTISILLLLMEYDWWIEKISMFYYSILIFSYLIYILPVFTLRKFPSAVKYLGSLLNTQRNVKLNKSMLSVFILVFLLLYVILLLVLPLVSICVLAPLIKNHILLAITFFLQFFTLSLISSWISGNTALKELGNSLTNYADIESTLSTLISERKIDITKYEILRKRYLAAKPYNVLSDDTFKLFTLYMLVPNRAYVEFIVRRKNSTKR